ncbi:MAG: hypothetical protein JRF33_10195 [Deltaproteobacteria bacterium]|nr:hypothetical protein [Deltaproteobacteria bacterium]
MRSLCLWVALGCLGLLVACGGSVGGEQDAGSDAGLDAGSDAGVDAGGDTGGDEASTACNLDAAQPPWPDWVPAWPGAGRNATGRTEFRVLSDGAVISNLRIEGLSAQGFVVAWETSGDADSSVAWGTSAEQCPLGYARTGARRTHRMLVAPLDPETEVHVWVRSRDDATEDLGQLLVTTPALTSVTELSACGDITESGNYRLTCDVQADCTCFRVLASDVHLDLGWHQVTYAAGTTSEQCHGVYLNADRTRVSSGLVVQGAQGGDLYSHALSGRGAEDLEFDRIWLRVHTADAFGLRTMYAGDVKVHDLVVVSEVRDVTDRHYPGNRGIALDLSPEDAAAEVYDCVLFGVPHWGIMFTGDERLTTRPAGGQTRSLRNNHVFADMHATNGYALGVHANHMEVHHNEIRPLVNGRAVHYTASNGFIHHNIVEALELIEGNPAEGFAYYSDSSDPHSPHDSSVCTWVVAHGIRVESGNFGEVANNEVYVYSLPDVSFGSTALNISTGAGAAGGNEVHHNQFTAHRAEGSIGCAGGGVPTLAGWVRGETPVEAAQLHDNRFVSNGQTLDIEEPALATSQDDELVGP